jgi:hypothetical protein
VSLAGLRWQGEGAPPTPGQSKVELYAALRREAREGMANRALERSPLPYPSGINVTGG